MNNDNSNAPAFGRSKTATEFGTVDWGAIGLTKREYMAALAMQALADKVKPNGQSNPTLEYAIALDAVAIADALLKVLSQNES